MCAIAKQSLLFEKIFVCIKKDSIKTRYSDGKLNTILPIRFALTTASSVELILKNSDIKSLNTCKCNMI